MFGQSTHEERKLRKHGKSAPAEVVEAQEGHWIKTSGNPQLVSDTQRSWALRLRVEPPGQPSFEAEVHTYLGQLEVPQPGRRFTVLYDPDDHTKVAIDHSESGVVDAVASQIASRHPGADSAVISALLQKKMKDPDSVSTADLAAAIPGATVLSAGSVVAAPGAGAPDPVDLLTKLETLHDHGVVDDEEFEAQKARILGERGSTA